MSGLHEEQKELRAEKKSRKRQAKWQGPALTEVQRGDARCLGDHARNQLVDRLAACSRHQFMDVFLGLIRFLL